MLRLTTIQKLLLIAYGRERYIPGFQRNVGLCRNLGLSRHDKTHFKSWEFYSGIMAYPVPSPKAGDFCCNAYYDLFLYRGVYGDLRRDLALHLARCLQKEQHV